MAEETLKIQHRGEQSQSSENITVPPIFQACCRCGLLGAVLGSVAGPGGAVVGGVIGAIAGKSAATGEPIAETAEKRIGLPRPCAFKSKAGRVLRPGAEKTGGI
jgi:hypothetical protein